MILKVYTGTTPPWAPPYYLAEFVDVWDSDTLLVRCSSKAEIHKVSRRAVVLWETG